MEKESLGLIETLGLVAAIEAADAGSKAANVTFRGYERARAGLITVVFVGDVAAVRAAVSAGVAAAKQVGTVVSVHVIARPDQQLHVSPNGAKSAQPEITPASVEVAEQAPVSPGQEGQPAPMAAPSAPAEQEEASAPSISQAEEGAVATPAREEAPPPAAETPRAEEIAAEFGGGNGPVIEEEPEPAAAISAPAGRKKEKVRKTRSRRKA